MSVLAYRTLGLREIALEVVLLLVLSIPTPAYARKEFWEHERNPSPPTLRAFRGKNREAFQIRRAGNSCSPSRRWGSSDLSQPPQRGMSLA